MGKRIDELPLNDDPIEHQVESLEALTEARERDTNDERDQPWYQFVGRIDDLLADREYTFATDTLTGIKETVEHTRRVTEGQKRAVNNIENRGEGRRRYEGWAGRWR